MFIKTSVKMNTVLVALILSILHGLAHSQTPPSSPPGRPADTSPPAAQSLGQLPTDPTQCWNQVARETPHVTFEHIRAVCNVPYHSDDELEMEERLRNSGHDECNTLAQAASQTCIALRSSLWTERNATQCVAAFNTDGHACCGYSWQAEIDAVCHVIPCNAQTSHFAIRQHLPPSITSGSNFCRDLGRWRSSCNRAQRRDQTHRYGHGSYRSKVFACACA